MAAAGKHLTDVTASSRILRIGFLLHPKCTLCTQSAPYDDLAQSVRMERMVCNFGIVTGFLASTGISVKRVQDF
jgi:hypothetical protein